MKKFIARAALAVVAGAAFSNNLPKKQPEKQKEGEAKYRCGHTGPPVFTLSWNRGISVIRNYFGKCPDCFAELLKQGMSWTDAIKT
jgi:hypothetical protein